MLNEEKKQRNMTASKYNNSPMSYANMQQKLSPAEVCQQLAGNNPEFGLNISNEHKNMRISKSVNGYPVDVCTQLSLQMQPSPKSKMQSDWHSMTDNEREILQRERRKQSSYKTALCQAFKVSGACNYGIMCRFAHGDLELRLPPAAHPKYKTQLCNKFALKGSCPYGARCQFIHQKPNEQVMWGDLDSMSPIPPVPRAFSLRAYQPGLTQATNIARCAYNFGNLKTECDQILLSPAHPDFVNSFDSSGQRSFIIGSSGDYANCGQSIASNQPRMNGHLANQFINSSNAYDYYGTKDAHDNTIYATYKTPSEVYNERDYRLFSQSCVPKLH